MKAIYGKKVGMTQIFAENGKRLPVTVLEVGPNIVQQVKSEEVEVTLQPAPEPRLSVAVMVPVLPVELPAVSETVVAERVAVAVVERDKLPALTVA